MSDEATKPDPPERPQINWFQVVGGALAAVSSALVLSTLGTKGTIIGAALGSAVLTVGSSVYSHYLAISKERLAKAQSAALTKLPKTSPWGARVASERGSIGPEEPTREQPRPVEEPSEVLPGPVEEPTEVLPSSPEPPTEELPSPTEAPTEEQQASPAEERSGDQTDQLDKELAGEQTELLDEEPFSDQPDQPDEESRPAWREAITGLPWKHIWLSAAGIFVLAVAIITTFELATGREVSSYTGGSSKDQGPGTSLVGFVGGGGRGSNSPSPTPSGSPSGPTSPSPSPTGTGSPSPTPSETGTPSPTESPTESPTAQGTQTQEPTGTPTPTHTPTSTHTPTP